MCRSAGPKPAAPRLRLRARREYYTIPCPARRGGIAAALRAACTARDLFSTPGGLRRAWDLLAGGKNTPRPSIEVCTAARAGRGPHAPPRTRRRSPRCTGDLRGRPLGAGSADRGAPRADSPPAGRGRGGENCPRESRLLAGRIGREALEEMLPTLLEQVADRGHRGRSPAVIAVGTIGDQAADDLSRMRTGEDFSGEKRPAPQTQRTTLCRVERLADWSAALLTLRDYCQFRLLLLGERRSRLW